ncbi:hypothetical protein BCR42DRAFT_408288 [Absidia repens]|uniref:Uncharacterized protein n=1 Tax=Absidia repens TaxID=90262 RepID=A0A1X2IPM8_9FUNG|nr:hypothetical protein BCR42DRAFT_408288 [Absidia repens]
MSSVSSHDGSDKDSLRHKGNSDGLPSRYASLRKTDLLDAMETFKNRDTDSWSVAATIDDQESVISMQGVTLASSSTTTLDTIHNVSNDDDSLSGRILVTSLGKDNCITISNTSSNNNNGNNHSNSNSNSNNNGNNNSNDTNASQSSINHSDLVSQKDEHMIQPLALETLRDLADHNSITTGGDDDDKQSRSNAAEFGDDGTRSAATDFDDSDSGDNDSGHGTGSRGGNDNDDDNSNHDHLRLGITGEGQNSHPSQQERSSRHHRRQRQHHDVVNDSIAAPPQPQPSFTPVAKSYVELLEENDILQTQIHNLRITQKHQAKVIDNLRSLTECTEKVFDKAINLCQLTPDEQQHLIKVSQIQQDSNQQHGRQLQLRSDGSQQQEHEQERQQHESTLEQQLQQHQHHHPHHHSEEGSSCAGFSDPTETTTPIVYAHTITELLSQLSLRVHQFVVATVDMPWQLLLEQHLFAAITDAYLMALPFGTDNQQLLNTAYRDQLRRFQSTLGSSFAKWYRRQTVQSLSLNPATKEYLEHMKEQLSLQLVEVLNKREMQKAGQPPKVDHDAWSDVLHWCRNLSLEIHGGDADVIVQPITTGIDFDADIMTKVVADDQLERYTISNDTSVPSHSTPNDDASDSVTTMGKVKFVISPLFIDEDDRVLLTARVLLE